MSPSDFKRALASPALVFKSPNDVLRSDLATLQKRQILEEWELDARALQVAAEENMSGGEPSRLAEVRRAINELASVEGVPSEGTEGTPAPTKTGGLAS